MVLRYGNLVWSSLLQAPCPLATMWDGSLSVLFSFPILRVGMKTRYASSLESYVFLFPLPVPSASHCGLSDMFVLSRQCLFPLPWQLFGIRVLCPCPVPCVVLWAQVRRHSDCLLAVGSRAGLRGGAAAVCYVAVPPVESGAVPVCLGPFRGFFLGWRSLRPIWSLGK